MKKIMIIAFGICILSACNNAAKNDTTNDSLNTMNNADVNNRNTTLYDSATLSKDTVSYERQQNKVGDSTSKHNAPGH